MKTIFNPADKNEILNRIDKLTPESKALWGKMNVAQMLAHSANAAKMPTGEISVKGVGFPISILGKVFKPMVLKGGDMRKNSPTSPEIKVTDPCDFRKEKENFINAFNKLGDMQEKAVKNDKHPFFGKMRPAEWGRINYIHADHHLKQFGV